MIEYVNVSKSYNGAAIINSINLKVHDGEFLVIIGPSGCGKTTTLKLMNRLIDADSGEILIDNQNIKMLDIVKLRTEIGYVIQEIALFPNMTVEENICVVPKIKKWDKQMCIARTHELLTLANMDYDTYAKKYPNELSGGQQQRIGVLRALAAKPRIVLMDEPFGALDPIMRDSLQNELKRIQKQLGITIIFITHDMSEALKLADRIIFMDNGRILQSASPKEMRENPSNETIRRFIHNDFITTESSAPCRTIMRPIPDENRIKNSVPIGANEPIQKAYQKFIQNQSLESLIVIDLQGDSLGMITKDALIQALAKIVWSDN